MLDIHSYALKQSIASFQVVNSFNIAWLPSTSFFPFFLYILLLIPLIIALFSSLEHYCPLSHQAYSSPLSSHIPYHIVHTLSTGGGALRCRPVKIDYITCKAIASSRTKTEGTVEYFWKLQIPCPVSCPHQQMGIYHFLCSGSLGAATSCRAFKEKNQHWQFGVNLTWFFKLGPLKPRAGNRSYQSPKTPPYKVQTIWHSGTWSQAFLFCHPTTMF